MADDTTTKWLMGIVASLIILGVSFVMSMLYARLERTEEQSTAMAKLAAEQAQQQTHATNVIRRLYEHQEQLDAALAQLKERVGKLEIYHERPLRAVPHSSP